MGDGGRAGRPVAVIAGGGVVPALVAESAARSGYEPTVFATAGEADPAAFIPLSVHVIRWGQIGRLFRLAGAAGCRDAVLVGSISHRPALSSFRPDFVAIRLMPRIFRLLRKGDDSLLREVAAILEERGLKLLSPLDIAPQLALPEGSLVGQPSSSALRDIELAVEAARQVGRLDIGQGAVAVAGLVIAVEDERGTDNLLHRVAALRRAGHIAGEGGVLVKCMKPQQDPRLDVPTIGPQTAERARRAGLEGVAAEAGRALLAGPEATIEAFRTAGLFLAGIPAPIMSTHG